MHEVREREKKNFVSPRLVSPLLAWGDFHARSRFARSTIPEEKWGLLVVYKNQDIHKTNYKIAPNHWLCVT